jgi:hypothetical protein
MRLTKKEKIKELASLKKQNVLMTDNDYKELKLGQLEDIEDKLGIDLLVYSKMTLGTTVYSNKYGFGEQDLQQYIYSFWYKAFCIKGYKGELIPVYYVKDYGKTWALTKDELADE